MGRMGMPGLTSALLAEGRGLMQMPPVSVCHQVSTTAHFSLPTTVLYQCQASTLMGSPYKIHFKKLLGKSSMIKIKIN